MLGETKALELLDLALDACECDQAEVILHMPTSALTRFADSVIHQNVAEANAMVSVRAVLGKRVGCARGNQLDPEEVRAVAKRALDLARVAGEDEQFVSLPQPQPVPEVKSFAEATDESTPEQRADVARAIAAVTEAHGCKASGSLSAESGEIAIANSLGVRVYSRATESTLIAVASDDDASGYAEWRGTDISQLDARAVADRASEKCVAARGAKPIEPGEYAVVLEPPAVGDMLFMLSYMGMGAMAFQEGRSFLSGKVGERICGENITIWDDPSDERQLTSAFDWEGVARQKVTIIEEGVARGPAYDSYTAHKEGKQSTGHAFPAPNTMGPIPIHLFLGPGDASVENMVASTERGLLITRFHYTNIVHEKQTLFTGMTRDGTFLIENGKVVRPVSNLRFTQSILGALSQVEMIGKDLQLVEYACVPALRIGKFAFTS
ncbi:MAG: TldD/PmbA family protein [Armatimonadetes bacterium]|nr:TldD/PmbA family protein [Armatimonadota bacterium]